LREGVCGLFGGAEYSRKYGNCSLFDTQNSCEVMVQTVQFKSYFNTVNTIL